MLVLLGRITVLHT